jgi:hypothetical protein
VRQHGPESAVADHADVWHFCSVFAVDYYAAAVVDVDAYGFEIETFSEGSATDGD